jgi:hypothetical protein
VEQKNATSLMMKSPGAQWVILKLVAKALRQPSLASRKAGWPLKTFLRTKVVFAGPSSETGTIVVEYLRILLFISIHTR